MPRDKEEGNEIESLKKKLYSRTGTAKPMSDIRSPLSPKEVDDLPKTFQEPITEEIQRPIVPPIAALMTTRKKGLSFAAKFLMGSVGFFILAAGAALYIFLGGGNVISPDNIDIQVVAPSLVDSGKQGAIQVIVDNRNTSALTLVDMLVDYPDGTRNPANPTAAMTHIRNSIGTIASGQQIKQNIDGIFYGAEGSAQKVTVTLQYNVAGSNAVFQKTAEADFRIGSSPISLSINAPDTIVAGQSFPVDITVQSNAAEPQQNVVVQGQYPFGFTPVSSTPSATAGGTFWNLGTMQPGSSQVIHLVGSVNGQDGDARVLRFMVGSNTDSTDTTIEVPVLTVPQTVTVRKPFITASIAINGQNGDGKTIAVAQGATLQGVITWKNNLSVGVTNAQFVLTLKGPALDKSSVGSNSGFYQSQTNTITWSPTQEATLASVPPGGTGQLQFSFATVPPGTGGTLITNPTINLLLDVAGTSLDSGSGPQQVSAIATTNVSVASQLSLTAQALHFTGPITNSGPMPPKAEQNTSYTVEWAVKNSSNIIGNAIVTAILPTYVRYVSTGAVGVSYDSSSRTVTWNLGDLPAGVGYSTAERTADFQVVLSPSTSQIGTIPHLTGPAVLHGQDRYAQVSVTSNADAVSTQLTESGFISGMETVVAK
jgi:hypothetical protein